MLLDGSAFSALPQRDTTQELRDLRNEINATCQTMDRSEAPWRRACPH